MDALMKWAWPTQLARLLASIPSILGSLYIIQHVSRSEKRRKRAFTRILLVMSVMDLIFAITSVFSSSITPRQVPVPYHTLSMGTWTTCQVFGFFGHGASLSSVLYNASLSLYYVLTIRNGWTDWRIHQNKKVEVLLLHVMPLLIGWSIAVAALPLNLYNPTFVGCGIISYPPACESPIRPNIICERGKHADIYRLAFLDGWVWIVFIFLVTSMILIYAKLAKIDRASPNRHHRGLHQQQQQSKSSSLPLPSSAMNDSISITRGVGGLSAARPSRRSSRGNLNRLKHQFAIQALLYALAFFLTYFFDTVALILRALHIERLLFPCCFLANVFLPLQGFWNAFIYVRPRYLRYRKKQKQEQARLEQQQEARHWHRKRAEASILAQAARIAAQHGSAFIQALSAKAEDDEDDAEQVHNQEDEKEEEKEEEFIRDSGGGGGGGGASSGAHSSESHARSAAAEAAAAAADVTDEDDDDDGSGSARAASS